MNPKSLLPAVLLLATLILLAPTVHSCVNFFAAQGQTNGVFQPTWLDARLWDTGGGSTSTQVCSLSNYPDGSGTYHFNCIDNYSASFNEDQAYSGTVSYSTPGGHYQLTANCLGACDCDGCNMWKACDFNCQGSECFIDNCGIDYKDCQPQT